MKEPREKGLGSGWQDLGKLELWQELCLKVGVALEAEWLLTGKLSLQGGEAWGLWIQGGLCLGSGYISCLKPSYFPSP